jgi:hypothetical protein
MGQVSEIIAGLEHGRIHQGRQIRVVAILNGFQGCLHCLGLQRVLSARLFGLFSAHNGSAGRHTSPFSSVNSSLTLSPSITLSVTSEATQPSAVSGCQARVPKSKMCAILLYSSSSGSCRRASWSCRRRDGCGRRSVVRSFVQGWSRSPFQQHRTPRSLAGVGL